MPERVAGAVKQFNVDRGFGFIIADKQRGDVFVHVSELRKNAINALVPGERVTFEMVHNGEKGYKAVDVQFEADAAGLRHALRVR